MENVLRFVKLIINENRFTIMRDVATQCMEIVGTNTQQ